MSIRLNQHDELDERQRFLLYQASHRSSHVVMWTILAGLTAASLAGESVAGLALIGVLLVMVIAQLTFLARAKVNDELLDLATNRRRGWGWLFGWSIAFVLGLLFAARDGALNWDGVFDAATSALGLTLAIWFGETMYRAIRRWESKREASTD